MEKLEYLLIEREFLLVAGLKALESIKTKVEFRTGKTRRWMCRLERFSLKVLYRKGVEPIEAEP